MAATAPAAIVGGISAEGMVLDEESLLLKANFKNFLTSFVASPADSLTGPSSSLDLPTSQLPSSTLSQSLQPLYLLELLDLARHERTSLVISYRHLTAWHGGLLALPLLERWLQVEPYLAEAVKEVMEEGAFREVWKWKRDNLPEAERSTWGDVQSFRRFPRYHVSVHSLLQHQSIRELTTHRLGHLVSIGGTVTRSSAVRPELLTATFLCGDCQTRHEDIQQQFRYTQPLSCRNPTCSNRTKFNLDLSACLFVDWQSLKLQENATEIPAGSMPRSLKVVLRNEMVELVKPGDTVIVTGTLIVVPEVGMMSRAGVMMSEQGGRRGGGRGGGGGGGGGGQGVKGLKELGVRELSYSLVFLACHIGLASTGVDSRAEVVSSSPPDPLLLQSVRDEDLKDSPSLTPEGRREAIAVKREYHTFLAQQPPEIREQILRMKRYPKHYTRLVQSLATSVYGHDELKRGLLLMLLGGVHKRTKDGASLRGDINVCIVGDPSTSKSQFLKFVCKFHHRAVYTSGKASSAAGLTASVVRDVETGEFGIEAGALMLADNGFCCIDEFDKMEPTDQVAIHEAMEQQTISIAKAGIQATLNARTSVLAAANPIKGRYDRTKTLKQNVDISAPIMSRFDLFFVVLDEQDEATDFSIAQHIINVHCNEEEVKSQAVFQMEDLQLYVKAARLIRPRLTPEAQRYLVDSYVLLRTNDSVGVSRSSYRITVRQLESLIRLSEARARLDLSAHVTVVHVKEAARLLKKSIVRVETGDVMLEDALEAEGGEETEGGEQHIDAEADAEWNPDDERKEAPPSSPSASASPPPAAPPVPAIKRTLQLKVSEYNSISLALRHLLRLNERNVENPYRPNMKQQHLIQAYMERHWETIEDVEEEMRKLRLIVQLVINDGKILVVKPSKEDKGNLDREDAEEEKKEGKKVEKVMKRLLMCHPNFDGVDEEEEGRGRGRRAGYGQVRGSPAEDGEAGESGGAENEGERQRTDGMDERDEKDEKEEVQEEPSGRSVHRVDSNGSVEGGRRRKRGRAAPEPTVREAPMAERPAPLSPESPTTPSTGESVASRRSQRSRGSRRNSRL